MSHPHRMYLWRLGGIGFLLILSILVFNVLVDPYDVFGMPRWQGFNAVKHGFMRNPRIAKAYAVTRYGPDTIILGTSRTESAMDPKHPLFEGKPTYNLAFSGGSVYEMYRYLQHASATGTVKRAVVSIDFFLFNRESQWLSADYSEERLAVGHDGSLNPFPWADLASLAFSGSALKESWWSLRHQRSQHTVYLENGYRDDSRDIPDILRKRGGQREEFIEVERQYAKTYRTLKNPIEFSKIVTFDPFDDIERMLAWGRDKGIEIVFVIPPVHARHLELIHQLGLWPKMEDWQRRLVRIIYAGSEESSKCRLWSFTGFNDITSEDVPPRGDATPMKWWRESSHATSAAGWRMLETVRSGATQGNNSSFGRCLTPATIEPVLAETRNARGVWERSHPDDVDDIFRLL